jgi:hypothetical protein
VLLALSFFFFLSLSFQPGQMIFGHTFVIVILGMQDSILAKFGNNFAENVAIPNMPLTIFILSMNCPSHQIQAESAIKTTLMTT